MKIFAFDLSIEENFKLYENRYDRKKYKNKPYWDEIVNDPKNHYDALEFYKKHGKKAYGWDLQRIEYPTTITDFLIDRVYFNKGYEHYRESFPEDMCEERTDWNTMCGYADDLANFVDTLISFLDE